MTDPSSLRTKLNTASLLIADRQFDAAENLLLEIEGAAPGDALGPETTLGHPRRLQAAWLRLAKARGDETTKIALQYGLVPPEEALLPLFFETAFPLSDYVAGQDRPVPPTLHQVWIGGPPPETTAAWAKEAMAWGWDYRLWDEKALREIDVTDDPVWRHMRDRDDLPGAVDVARYHLLARHGGLYLDCDWMPVPGRPLTSALPARGLSAIAETTPRRTGTGSPFLNNAVLAAPPDHPVFRHLIDLLPEVIRRLPRGPAWWVTGPLVFTLAARMGPVTILDTRLSADPLTGDRTTVDAALARIASGGPPAVLAPWKPWDAG